MHLTECLKQQQQQQNNTIKCWQEYVETGRVTHFW